MQTTNKRTIFLILFFLSLIYGVFPVNGQKTPKNIPAINTSAPSPLNRDTYNAAAKDYEDNGGQERRNRLMYMAISQIDLEFNHFIRTKRRSNSFFQTVLDILEVGAATAISITNGERAKSVIADALGFVQGSRTKINENLRLLEQQVLVNQMVENRSEVLTGIYAKLNEPDANYPFERAYIDILAYYQAGTTDSALSSLAASTGTNAATAQQNLANAKTNAGITLAPTIIQIQISAANSAFVQGYVDTYEAEEAKKTAAGILIAGAIATIAAENGKAAPAVPNAAVIAANAAIKVAELAKQVAAEAAKKVALDKLKAIFNLIEQDTVLEPLLDKVPQRFPGGAPVTTQMRLDKIRAKNGAYDDYGFVILRFFRLVTDAAPSNPTVVDRAKNIVDSLRP